MFITDIIAETFKLWQLGTLVLISAPTGMGKTFFILNVLLPYAMENGVEILYLSNRTMLNKELVKKVCDMNSIPYELMKDKNVAEFPGITIMTYQTLQQMLGGDLDYSRIPFFYYVVADEIHYLCSDSDFSPEVQRFYKWFMNCNSPVKIAISATIEPVLPYLFDVNDGWADIIISDHLTMYQRIQRNIINFALNQTERCFFYTVRDKATEYKVHVYESVDDLVSVINEDISDSKWLIFQSNKEKAEENLKKKLFCSAAMLSADSKDSKTMKTLIEQNMFEEKVLITTKVLDNGISIHDRKVRNIVLSTTSWADFIQMKGRRRIHPDENVQLNIYLPKLSKKYFENSLKANIEPALQLFERPISEVLEVALSSNEGRKLVHQYYDIIHGKLTLNQIAKKELTKKAELYCSFIDGLKNDPDYFVKEQLKWLGGIDYEHVVNLTEKRYQKALTDLVSVLTKQVEEPELLKNEQLHFRAQVKPMLAILCPSKFDHSNRMPGLNFINSCFKELGLQFRIDSQGGKKKGEETKWLIKIIS